MDVVQNGLFAIFFLTGFALAFFSGVAFFFSFFEIGSTLTIFITGVVMMIIGVMLSPRD